MQDLAQKLSTNMTEHEQQKLQIQVAVGKLEAKFDVERMEMNKALQNKCDQINALTVELDSLQEEKMQIEQELGP